MKLCMHSCKTPGSEAHHKQHGARVGHKTASHLCARVGHKKASNLCTRVGHKIASHLCARVGTKGGHTYALG